MNKQYHFEDDEDRDEETQAEIDREVELNNQEDAMRAEDEEFERKRGGARAGAGRKPDSAKAHTREPLYQAGYNAGYQAGLRTRHQPYLVQVLFKYNPDKPTESGVYDTFDTEEEARVYVEEMKQDKRFDYAALHRVDKAGYTLHREIISK